MGCYKILSTPLPFAKEGYKGLHRAGPKYGAGINEKYVALWKQYIEHSEPVKHMGITTEFTVDELKEFACLVTQEEGKFYEVIYFSEQMDCPHESQYYGVDVTDIGGYSMVGEEFFLRGRSQIYDILIDYFMEKLNAYGLFSEYEEAEKFRDVIMELSAWRPGCIEDEEWKILHVLKVL